MLELAHKRLSTIFIGGSACVIVTILVFPVWAGEDLHNLIASNIEKLGDFLEGIYFSYVCHPEKYNSAPRPNVLFRVTLHFTKINYSIRSSHK